jgi:broad-specificity NMP kinase
MAPRIFITGIPTAGKSYLAKKLAKELKGRAVLLDDFREALQSDEKYKNWVNFYLAQDEKAYLEENNSDQMWKNLVLQSEALWPAFFKKIMSYESERKPIIFECVNILPHLAHRDIQFPGIVMIGSSYQQTLERNLKEPRWSNDPELQELEAKMFFYIERPHYKSEAEKYSYPVFEDSEEAFNACLGIINQQR